MFTSPLGASRIGGAAVGLEPWQTRGARVARGRRAARHRSAGAAITMTAADGVEFARACPLATIVPVHVEDWAHFTENREIIQHAFDSSGLAQRLRWPVRGSTITVAMHDQTAQPR